MNANAPLIDLRADHLDMVHSILARHVPDCEVLAFGSRATWTAKNYSDLDLAILGDAPLPFDVTASLTEAFDASMLPIRVDVVDCMTVSEDFLKIIRRDGVVLQTLKTRDEFDGIWESVAFGKVIEIANEKRSTAQVDVSRYVSTDNMYSNFGGITAATTRPPSGSVTLFRSGDTLFSNIRTYFRKVWRADFSGTCSNDVLVFRPKDPHILVSDFLFHLCRWQKFTDYTVQTSKGAKMPRGDKEAIKKFGLCLPALREQRAISAVLSALDNRIDLNRRMNETLEAMARALFRDWFVDFGPTRRRMALRQEGREQGQNEQGLAADPVAIMGGAFPPEKAATLAPLFPAKLADDGLPEGWKKTLVGEHIKILDSKRVPLSAREREKRIGPYPYYGATSVMGYVDDYLFDDIFLLLGEDGSVIRPNGKPFTQYVWGKVWVNNHAHVLKGKTFSTEQLKVIFDHVDIAPFTTGAVQLKLNQKNMKSVSMTFSGLEVHRAYDELISPLFAKLRANIQENQTLAEMRDLLLPKLISGEIRLKDAEMVV